MRGTIAHPDYTSPVPFLVAGDIHGQFSSLDKYISTAQRKQGPFRFVICVGCFFGPDSPISPDHIIPTEEIIDWGYLTGERQFPIPVFFIDLSSTPIGAYLRTQKQDGYKFSATLEYLGGFGVRIIDGIKIAFLSGRYSINHFLDEADDELSIDCSLDDLAIDGGHQLHMSHMLPGLPQQQQQRQHLIDNPSSPPVKVTQERKYFAGPHSAFYCISLINRFKERLLEDVGKLDLLITGEWPSGLDSTLSAAERNLLAVATREACERTNIPIPDDSPAVAEIIELAEPRYVVCTGRNIFYQRSLFRTTTKGLACRIVGLGALTEMQLSIKSTRFMHAFNLKPLQAMANNIVVRATPANSTPSPFYALYSHLNNNPTMAGSIGLYEDDFKQRLTAKRSWSQVNSPTTTHSSPTTTRSMMAPDPMMMALSNSSSNSSPVNHHNINNHPMNSNNGSSSTTPPPSIPQGECTDFSSKRLRSAESGEQPQPPPFLQFLRNRLKKDASEPTVLVSNIPAVVDCESFCEAMKTFGPLVSLDIPRNPDGTSTGQAWVTYKTMDAAYAAARASQQLESGGNLLRIQLASINRHNERRSSSSNESRRRSDVRTKVERMSSEVRVDVRPHADCWFCLSNPKCERRLIVALGKKSYIALAKGGVVPRHVLVVPISHYPNLTFCSEDTLEEMETFVSVLRRCFAALDMGTVVYERHVPMKASTGMHMQIQVIPIPLSVASGSLGCFFRKAERVGRPQRLNSNEPSSGGANNGVGLSRVVRALGENATIPYFYFEAPGDPWQNVTQLLLRNFSPFSLPLNFGREITAELLHMPERAEWRRCVESDEVESQQAAEMQQLLKPFLPSQH